MNSFLVNSSSTKITTETNTKFIVKLFGKQDHNNLKVTSTTITISKTQINKYENKGQISKWIFEFDQIYSEDSDFGEIFEVEIYSSDFLSLFNEQKINRTLICVGEKHDNLSEEPYHSFIQSCINECLNKYNKNNSNLYPVISFVEITKNKLVDYFNTDDNNFIVKNPKISYSKNDIIIEGVKQISIESYENYNTLIKYAKEKINLIEFPDNYVENNESLSQLITIKLINKNDNECFSKFNILLYKAYEINRFENEKFKLYTKDNWEFFNGLLNKINYRSSYIIKYIKDTLTQGKNLILMILPCEYYYIILLHDMLNYIKTRKLIIENFNIGNNNIIKEIKLNNSSNKIINNNNNDYYASFGTRKENNFIDIDDYNDFFGSCKKIKLKDNNTFTSESGTCESTFISTNKHERKNLNIERLEKIVNKKQINKLFNLMDTLY
jgi:hypothetical protein